MAIFRLGRGAAILSFVLACAVPASAGDDLAAGGPRIVLGGAIDLTAAATYDADEVVLAPDLVLTTNGFALAIRTRSLVISGAPRVISFKPQTGQASGRSAGDVTIQAAAVTGSGLEIDNMGEAGAPGAAGANGVKGMAGGPGGAQNFIDCLFWARPHSGIPGGPGGLGGDGGYGAPGGRGGDAGFVSLVLPLNAWNAIAVPTDRALSGAAQNCGGTICGGMGGAGGGGGAGGDGGAGGPGTPGVAWCPDGPQGAVGPAGRPGPAGPDGIRGMNTSVQKGSPG